MDAKPIRVLLTEDEPYFAELISNMLADSGLASYEVSWAKNMKSCLGSLDDSAYNVLLLDLHLPDSIALDTVKKVRQHHHGIPIVALTGQEEETIERDAIKAGAQDFFKKSELSAKLLGRVINYAIDRRSMELELERHAADLEERVQRRTRQLQTAKDQWENTFDALPDRIAIIDRDFVIQRANKALAKAADTTPQALVGRPCHEIMQCELFNVDQCPHELLIGDGKEHVVEIHSASLQQDLLVSTSPLQDEDGRLLGSVHVARDIKLIKQAQRTIAESERLHRTFLDCLPDPTVVYDNEGKVVYSNTAFERVFGWSMDELVNCKIDFVPPEAKQETFEKVKQMMRGEPLIDFETQRFNKSGERLNILINTSPLFGADKKQTGNIVTLRDMTAIRQAEAAQIASEQRFKDLVESMSEGLTMADMSGRITYTNARFCTMLGYPVGGLTGKMFEDLLDDNSRLLFKERWEQRKRGDEKKYEVVFKTANGDSIYAIVSPKALRDSDGNIISSFAIVTDITERKNLESQLLQAQKLEGIGQLAAGIAHEINTPTQYVLSNTGFLETSFGDLMQLIKAHRDFVEGLSAKGEESGRAAGLEDLAQELDFEFLAEEIPKALEANRDGLERIAKIVLSIKEFAHPGQEEKQPADLNRAIENTITVARNEWKYVAELEMDLDPDLPPVPCIVGEFNQVILNLIVNAAQAISETAEEGGGVKGLISVTTVNQGDFAEIRVADNGPGIPQKIRSRIFDPFFTTKEPGKGTGQGLAIAYRSIVNNHNGDIALETREGGGTEFVIRLPLA